MPKMKRLAKRLVFCAKKARSVTSNQNELGREHKRCPCWVTTILVTPEPGFKVNLFGQHYYDEITFLVIIFTSYKIRYKTGL